MPGKSGLEVAASVSRQHPGVKILIFTMHSGKTLHSAAREAGAHGVVQKSFAARDLVRAIEALIGGGDFFPKDSAPSSDSPKIALPGRWESLQRFSVGSQIIPQVDGNWHDDAPFPFPVARIEVE
jgi:DNA-binding NarL/FixJ family response regulator